MRQAQLEEFKRKRNFEKAKVLGLLLIVSFLFAIGSAPIQAEPEQATCPPFYQQTDPWYSTKISDLVSYLWVYHKSEVLSLPEFQDIQTIPKSYGEVPREFAFKITNDTQLAIRLTKQFGYGYGMNGQQGVAQPYGIFWQANYWAELFHQMMRDGSTVHQIWTCGRNHYGFDENFVAAAISMAHTYMGNGEGWSYSMNVNCNDLDPAVYGEHPFCINVPEPGYVLLPDGHVAFGVGGCPVYAMVELDGNGQTMPRYSHAGCFGAHSLLLIVPEAVKNQVTPGELGGAYEFANIIWGGNGDPALIHLIGVPELNPSPYRPNWEHWQQGYLALMKALNNYHVDGLDWNFSRLTRVPLDTRFPDEIKEKIVWESFPSPLEELAPAFADPSITLEGLKACLGSESSCVKFSGEEMAQSYALRVSEYLAKYGLFTWCQDSFIRPWLRNYVDDASINQLPNFDIATDGHYNMFQYADAFSRYDPHATISLQTKLPSTAAGTETKNSVSFSGNIIQAPTPITATIPLGGLPLPEDVPVIKPAIIIPNDTLPPERSYFNYAPILGSGLSSSFLGVFVFVTKVHRRDFREEELPESKDLLLVPSGVEYA